MKPSLHHLWKKREKGKKRREKTKTRGGRRGKQREKERYVGNDTKGIWDGRKKWKRQDLHAIKKRKEKKRNEKKKHGKLRKAVTRSI